MSKLGTTALANFSQIIEELEGLRKKTKQSKQIVQAGIIIVCILMVVGYIGYYIAIFNYSYEHARSYDPYGPMMDAEYWNIIWIFMGFLAFVGGPFIYLYIQNQKTTKLFQDKYYTELIAPLLQESYPELSYQEKGKIHNNKVLKSSRYEKFIGVEQRLCKNYISGTVGQVGIEIGQTNIKAVKDYKRATASNKTGAIGVDNFFRGIVVYLNPKFSSDTAAVINTDAWDKIIQKLKQYWGTRILSTAADGSIVVDIPFAKGKTFLSPPTEVSLDSSDFATQLDTELGLLFELAESINGE
jgi:hypothetical protein